MRAVLFLFVAFLPISAAGATGRAEAFDKPVRETILDLGSSPDQPDFPNLHRHLSCFYFPRFMVKQLDDDGNKGALRITITHLQPGRNVACTRARRQGEIVMSDGWDYYWGVKDGLVILLGADGLDGGINFDVFNARGKKIFKDDLLMLEYKKGLDFDRGPNGQLSLKYERVVHATCSLLKEGAACWNKLQRVARLKDAPMPRCDDSTAPNDTSDPSVIFFPVRVALFPRPSRVALSQTVKCRAAE